MDERLLCVPIEDLFRPKSTAPRDYLREMFRAFGGFPCFGGVHGWCRCHQLRVHFIIDSHRTIYRQRLKLYFCLSLCISLLVNFEELIELYEINSGHDMDKQLSNERAVTYSRLIVLCGEAREMRRIR